MSSSSPVLAEVQMEPLSEDESGKALAYLDPDIMEEHGISPGEILAISGADGRQVFARVGWKRHPLPGRACLRLDRALLDSLGTGPAEIRRPTDLRPLARVLLLSSRALAKTERERCQGFLSTNRLPATHNSTFSTALPGGPVVLSVRRLFPFDGGLITAQTEVEILDASSFGEREQAREQAEDRERHSRLLQQVGDLERRRRVLERDQASLREAISNGSRDLERLQNRVLDATKRVTALQGELADRRTRQTAEEADCRGREEALTRQIEEVRSGKDRIGADLKEAITSLREKEAALLQEKRRLQERVGLSGAGGDKK